MWMLGCLLVLVLPIPIVAFPTIWSNFFICIYFRMTDRSGYIYEQRNIRRDRNQAIWLNLLEDLSPEMFNTFREALIANPKLHQNRSVANILAKATKPTDMNVSMFKYREPPFCRFLDLFIQQHNIRFKQKRSFPIPPEERHLWITLPKDYLRFYKPDPTRHKDLHLQHPAARDLFFEVVDIAAAPTASKTDPEVAFPPDDTKEAAGVMADILALTPPQSPRIFSATAAKLSRGRLRQETEPDDKKKSQKKRKERERDHDDWQPHTEDSDEDLVVENTKSDKELPPAKRPKLNDDALKQKFIDDVLKTMQTKLDIIRSDVQEIVEHKLADDACAALFQQLPVLKDSTRTLRQWSNHIQVLINGHEEEQRNIRQLIATKLAANDDGPL